VNLLDVVLIALLALAALNGFRRGAALQLSTYVGLLIGLVVGAILAPPLARLAESPTMQAAIAVAVLVGMAALGDGIGWAVGNRARTVARGGMLRGLDAVGGSLVAVIALLLAVWFIALSLVNGPIPAVSREIRASRIVDALDEALPAPPAVLAEVSQLLNRFGFPDVFAGLPPPPAEPVPVPASDAVTRAARTGQPGTVEIVGQGCGVVIEGSGFVAAEHYVVTNAHVVAGVEAPRVQKARTSQPATPVLFDPKMDIAVLYVKDTPGPVLAMERKDVARGSGGAVLGYPGGGPFHVEPAAVLQQLRAVGRDIYGRATVSRDVLELQAEVRPGNSGGPFVLPDGTVAGVVFAGSTTDQRIGYALTSGEVLPLVRRAEGRTGAVSTGACAR
jgi:S1-C subfamily serine protease